MKLAMQIRIKNSSLYILMNSLRSKQNAVYVIETVVGIESSHSSAHGSNQGVLRAPYRIWGI